MNITQLPDRGSLKVNEYCSFSWEKDKQYANTIVFIKDAECENPEYKAYVMFPHGNINLADDSAWEISMGSTDNDGGDHPLDDEWFFDIFDRLLLHLDGTYGSAPIKAPAEASIDFNDVDDNLVNETSAFMAREAFVNFKDTPYLHGMHRIQYRAIITLKEGDATQPKITEIDVECIPAVDKWTEESGIADEEVDRRWGIREQIYHLAYQSLCKHYGIETSNKLLY